MRQWKNFLPARMDVGCGGKPRLSAQVEIIFLRKRNYLSKRGKRGMITATRQIIRQDMGDSQSPMPLCRRARSYTIAFATPAPIITVFPSFFNSHFLTSYQGGLFVLQYGVCVCTYAVWGNYILHRFLFVSAGTGPAGCGCKSPPRPGPPRRDFVSIRQKP